MHDDLKWGSVFLGIAMFDVLLYIKYENIFSIIGAVCFLILSGWAFFNYLEGGK